MEDWIIVEIQQFLDKDLNLIKIPRKKRKRICALIYLYCKFEDGIEYSERDVNEILNKWHNFKDSASLRRLLFDEGFFSRNRDGSCYRKVEANMEHWKTLL